MFGKAKGASKGSFSKFFGFFFYFLLAISSISVANDFVFDQEFDRMIAPIQQPPIPLPQHRHWPRSG